MKAKAPPRPAPGSVGKESRRRGREQQLTCALEAAFLDVADMWVSTGRLALYLAPTENSAVTQPAGEETKPVDHWSHFPRQNARRSRDVTFKC